MKIVYYAHCQAIYDTPQEQRDVELLKTLGFEVLNPNMPEHKDQAVKIRQSVTKAGEQMDLDRGVDLTEARKAFWKDQASSCVMEYFENLVKSADFVAFRALPDGRIPAGIAKEISLGKPCFELPSGIVRRIIGVAETREYLQEAGFR